ncbi:MAG: energy-coupling factor transporter transmembrane component T family protein, partial [Stackebrandtia sp.]
RHTLGRRPVLSVTPIAKPGAFISRRNPAAKLACDAALSIAVLISIDWLTPTLLLAVVLLGVAVSGVSIPSFLYRLRLIGPAAALTAVISAVFAADKTGEVLIEAGPMLITSASVDTGVALGMRVITVACAAVAVFATTDPTELADSLIQQWRVSSRFAIGSLAAFRMLPMLAAQWRMIAMARRARGLDAGWNPIARIRLFGSIMFALLVGAIRRGTRLAIAMDARGFDSGVPRTIARPQRVDAADWLMIAITLMACIAAIAVSTAWGTFDPLW